MSKSAYPELIEALSSFKDFGFTQLQAAAYIAILQLGEDTGSAIAKASGINRSKIYDTLTQLEEMGAVKIVSRENRPRYAAVSPDEVFGSLLTRFTTHLDRNKSNLSSLMKDNVKIDPSNMTITNIKLKNLNINDYSYLISSNVRCRGQLLDHIDNYNKPNYDVKILDLNDYISLGLILLISEREVLLFPTPTGGTVDSIKIIDKNVSKFFTGIIESWWQRDLPDHIMSEINAGKLIGLHSGKTLFMEYTMTDGRNFIYKRPVTYLITNTHISFFYEGEHEEPKINLKFLTDVNINHDGSMELIFKNFKNIILGNLTMIPVEKSIFLKNILLTVSKMLN